MNDYQKTITLNNTANQVFAAVTEHVDGWWSDDFSGAAAKTGDHFYIAFGKTQKTFEVVEAAPGKRVVWLCLTAYMASAGLTKRDEWAGTRLIWAVADNGPGATLTLLHEGLNESLECYDICNNGWDYFMASIQAFLTTGTGTPYHKPVAVSA